MVDCCTEHVRTADSGQADSPLHSDFFFGVTHFTPPIIVRDRYRREEKMERTIAPHTTFFIVAEN